MCILPGCWPSGGAIFWGGLHEEGRQNPFECLRRRVTVESL